jgi:HK97 family phage major capsid protein/HK97 family phage prohead protease
MAEMQIEKVIGQTLKREFAINREMLDAENRSVQLSATSDTPIYQWFGWDYGYAYLILDHTPGSVRLDRINNGGCLLWNHDRDEFLGSVSNAFLRPDNKLECTATFSRSEDGEEKFQDVKDGLLKTVSAGFQCHSLERAIDVDDIDDLPVYRCRDWELLEVSLVTVPADDAVGVGRSHIAEPQPKVLEQISPVVREKINMENNMEPNENVEGTTPKPVAAPVVSAAVQRTAEFVAFAEPIGSEAVEFARTFVTNPANNDKSLLDMQTAMFAERAAKQSPLMVSSPENVAERNGIQPRTELARSNFRGGALKAFRGSNGHDVAYNAGKFLQAALFRDDAAMNYCREHGIQLERTQTGTQNEFGGFFVPVEVEAAIRELRIEYGVARRVTTVTPMSSDTKTVNRRVGGLSAVPVGPGQRGTKSKANWDQIELIARKWMVLAKYEDELSEDATISMADTLFNEMAYAFTFAEDNCLFNGDGSSPYHGIVGVIPKLQGLSGTVAEISGLQVASGNLWSEITEADLLAVVGRLPQFARKSGNVAWYCSHTFNATVLQRIALAKGGVTYAEFGGELKEVFLGKPVEIVEVMPTTEANSQIPVVYGNMSQAATMGDRQGVTVKMTDSNDVDFESDVMTVKGTERFDINSHDLGNATAVAADKKAGPIVGLITAAS